MGDRRQWVWPKRIRWHSIASAPTATLGLLYISCSISGEVQASLICVHLTLRNTVRAKAKKVDAKQRWTAARAESIVAAGRIFTSGTGRRAPKFDRRRRCIYIFWSFAFLFLLLTFIICYINNSVGGLKKKICEKKVRSLLKSRVMCVYMPIVKFISLLDYR